MSRIYCDNCEGFTEIGVVDVKKDKLNTHAWGDIVCTECTFVIATVEADIPGKYLMMPIKKKKRLGNEIN